MTAQTFKWSDYNGDVFIGDGSLAPASDRTSYYRRYYRRNRDRKNEQSKKRYHLKKKQHEC